MATCNKELVMNGKTNYPAGAPRRIRTLIADDSSEFRKAAGQFLERLPQVEVVGAAEDGEQALALVAGTRPDLVLMDLQMPRLNGLEATRRIHAEFPGVRVIVVTLYDSERWQAACVQAGADQFIPKHRLRDALPGALAQLFPGADLAGQTATPPAGQKVNP